MFGRVLDVRETPAVNYTISSKPGIAKFFNKISRQTYILGLGRTRKAFPLMFPLPLLEYIGVKKRNF